MIDNYCYFRGIDCTLLELQLCMCVCVNVSFNETRGSANANDSATVAEILKGNPKYMGASLTQDHAHFSSGCGLWWVLANPSCVRNLKSLASHIV